MSYREDLERAVREGQRAARKLEKLTSLPDFDRYPNGTVLAVAIGYPKSAEPYIYIGYRVKGLWYFTGGATSPNAAGPETVTEWLMKGPRQVLGTTVVGEIEVVNVPVVDLGGMLVPDPIARLGGIPSYGG